MKKLFLFVFGFVLIGSVFAYTPTIQDASNLNNLTSQLNVLVEDNNINLWDFYDQVKNLQLEYSHDARLDYMLGNIKDHLYTKLFSLKNAAKVSSQTFKQDFLDQHLTGIVTEISGTLDNCVGWYNTLDDISFAYNFPTALTMAVWYRESTCAYFLPSNGDGPFQILDKDYGTGEITFEIFVDTVVDFMELTRGKFDRYLTQLTGSLTYTGFDLTGISNFAGLYNGGTRSGDVIIPNRLDYLYDGYGEQYSGAIRYGIFPQFLKVLQWELSQ